jgi:hypothetical protein
MVKLMPALFINLKIDHQEKFDFFKITIEDLTGLFEECHVKIRGIYSKQCVEYIQGQLGSDVNFYQELQESDWVAATLEMLGQVKSRSVFLYFEDHRLVANGLQLEKTLVDFDRYNLDYLCYSFFRASQLDIKNLLPLGVTKRELFHEFDLTAQNTALIGKISPGYYTFSLLSLSSVKYLREVLSAENKTFKIFNKPLTSLIARLFPYARHRAVLKIINHALSALSARLCSFPPSTPFNIEHMWFESPSPIDGDWKLGVLKEELFANHDDDNGAYGESLIKRGLYPFTAEASIRPEDVSGAFIKKTIELSQGECFDLLYHSAVGRIRKPPIVLIRVESGSVLLKLAGSELLMVQGDLRSVYSNKGAVLVADEAAILELQIFDEAF